MNESTISHAEEIPFNGIRIRCNSTSGYDEVLARLNTAVGRMPLDQLLDVTGTRADFEARVKLHVGSSGFVLIAEMDHGPWIAKFGIQRRTRRWIFGNPLVAITMVQHDIDAGLFIPPDLLLVENADRNGCYVIYVEPSSLMSASENAPLRAAALELDRKIRQFVETATGT